MNVRLVRVHAASYTANRIGGVMVRVLASIVKLIFNEMMMRSALYQNNTLSWIFIVLDH
jgi:hypothetical protein